MTRYDHLSSSGNARYVRFEYRHTAQQAGRRSAVKQVASKTFQMHPKTNAQEDTTPNNRAKSSLNAGPGLTQPSFRIVAIGASAGGLEALEPFLSHAPVKCGMAFVVIQHLDPTRIGMMPERLQRFIDTPHHRSQLSMATPVSENENATQRSVFKLIRILLCGRTDHDFSRDKKHMLDRRIDRRLAIHQVDHITEYVHYLRTNPQEIDLRFKDLRIADTRFFRDPVSWRSMQEQALSARLTDYPSGASLRAWVAGCSSRGFSDREVSADQDCWYQVKIMPSRTQGNVTDGVVTSFNGISRAKRLEAKLRVDINHAKVTS
jgi:hypothetical protein